MEPVPLWPTGKVGGQTLLMRALPATQCKQGGRGRQGVFISSSVLLGSHNALYSVEALVDASGQVVERHGGL